MGRLLDGRSWREMWMGWRQATRHKGSRMDMLTPLSRREHGTRRVAAKRELGALPWPLPGKGGELALDDEVGEEEGGDDHQDNAEAEEYVEENDVAGPAVANAGADAEETQERDDRE
jgi:hypothetical protein